MLVEVTGFSQDMDFASGDVTNFVTIRLPNGGLVKAVVTDSGVRSLIEARAAAGPMPAAHEIPRTQVPQQSAPQEHQDFGETPGAVVFGGDGGDEGGEEEAPAAFWPGPDPQAPAPHQAPQASPIAHHDAATQQRLYQEEQKRQKQRAKQGPTMGRTVQKDDMGYPLAPRANGSVDANDVIGGGPGADEDGVGQG